MTARVLALSGLAEARIERLDPARDIVLDWVSTDRNTHLGDEAIEESLGVTLDPPARDLLEVAAAIVLGDQCVTRGQNEAWVRDVEYVLPVRSTALWRRATPILHSLLHLMTWDNIALSFDLRPGGRKPGRPRRVSADIGVDCVSLLSGGIDSFAGAVMLLESGRTPLFVTHQSRNPTIRQAQSHVLEVLEGRYAGRFRSVVATLGTSRVRQPLYPLPDDEERETSQRARSLWYLALACVCSRCVGVRDVYLCENGVLAAHLPMAPSRIGSFSTRTAHPAVLSMFADLVAITMDHAVSIANPFTTQTKGEMVRYVLRHRIPEQAIRGTESCWQSGRRPRPCGACVPCLMRALAFASAGVGQEVYEVDLLGNPAAHVQTEGYRNLVDLLSIVRDFTILTDEQLIRRYPDIIMDQLPEQTIISTYRRYAQEVVEQARSRFPELARLLGLPPEG